ncbi:MAG: DEAD/DEAH box helicase [Planctomycetia bacterium]|nr:DEAD/DEAH box helicase [Planctomycetia bacterium]
MRFTDLHLIEPLLRAVHEEGYVTPTPIQQQSIPHALAGKDLLGCAQTGTGKTAAFALPILQRLHGQPVPHVRPIRVLVLAPTRELATQIGDSFRAYGRHLPFRHTVIYGGVGQNPQVQALRHGVDVVVATPGRLLDLMQQGFVKLGHVEVLVLDEADRMLDLGFIHDVRRIVSAVPKKRQTLFFSATMPRDIQQLAHDILVHPVRVEVTPTATTVEKIAQSICFVDKGEKFTLLQKLLRDPAIQRALVFTRTKHGANKLARQLEKVGVRSDAIHGNKAQTARERALKDFSKGRVRVLVATDIAARGIDVEGITHVFNYDLPNVPDSYVHRIGRTARAGASGAAIAFCSPEERGELADIEKLIRMRIPVMAGYEGRFAGAREGGYAGGRAGGYAGAREGGLAHGHAPAHPPRQVHGGGHGHGHAPAHPSRPAHAPTQGHSHPPAHPQRPAHGGGHGHAAHPPGQRPVAGRLRGRHRRGR